MLAIRHAFCHAGLAPFSRSFGRWPGSKRSLRRGGWIALAESRGVQAQRRALLQFCQAALKDAEQQVQIFEKGVLKAFVAANGDSARGDEP
jgi:hypothetical protein